MHRLAGLLEQPAVAFNAAALANEPHRGPECRRGGRDHRNAMAGFERRGNAERAQAAAGDQNGFRAGSARHRPVAEFNDFGLALLARPTEVEQIEHSSDSTSTLAAVKSSFRR